MDKQNKSILETAIFAGGCFWCTEAVFQRLNGVEEVLSGYTGGTIKNPAYREICTGRTGHAEAIKITYDPSKVSYIELLEVFFATHDPTTLNRQGNDVGTQYRSAIYTTTPEQAEIVATSRAAYQRALDQRGLGQITTEIAAAGPFYYAETYHQQYLAKNPDGYCGLAGTGVSCPIGTGVAAQ